jgi:hypothetical protein
MVVRQEQTKIITKRRFCDQKIDLPNSTKTIYCKYYNKEQYWQNNRCLLNNTMLQNNKTHIDINNI